MSQKISFTNGYAGFTMVELMVTLAIAAIVTAFAIPALRDFVLNNRSAAFLNEFVVAANSARAEAVKRGAPVTLCSSSNPTAQNPTCDGGGIWETGWIVFADYNADRNIDLGTGACLSEEDCVLRVWGGTDGLTLRSSAVRITFDAMGAARGFNNTWELCDERGPNHARGVILSPGGRLRTAQDSNGDGIPENGGGNNFSC